MIGKPKDVDANQQILSRLGALQHDVNAIKQTTAFTLRSGKEQHLKSLKEIFKESKRRVQIYLAVNGVRSVKEIAEHLGMKRQNVGADLAVLVEDELIDLVDSGKSDIYAKRSVDRTIRISKFLTEEYGFTMDGLPAPAKGSFKSKRK